MKRGQVAIWVILGIVLVATIILFFIISRDNSIVNLPGSEGTLEIQSFIGSCVRSDVLEAIDIMLPQGGFITPKNPAFFDGRNIEYTCYNKGNFAPCIHQHPLLLNEMKLEIGNYVAPKLNECFEMMREEYSSRSTEVYISPEFDISVGLERDKVILKIEREISLRSREETRRINDLRIEIVSPAYNLALIAMEIADQEAKYCYFEFVGYNVIYPRYEVEQYSMSDSTNIYTIRDLESGKEMSIATRSCVIGAGGG